MRVRLLITSNPFVLAQMGAFLQQMSVSDPPDTKSWLVLSPRIDMNRIDFDPENLVDRMSALCKNIAAMIDLPIVDLPLEDREGVSLTGFSIFRVRNAISQRRHANRITAVFRELLSRMGVTADQVAEIWMANSPLEKPAQKVCQAAKITAFEHGLSDFYGAARYRHKPTAKRRLPPWMIGLYRRLEHLIVGVPRDLRLDRHVTLLGEQLSRFETELPHVQLDTMRVTQLLKGLSQHLSPYLNEFSSLPGPWCIVMVDTVTMHSTAPMDSSTYYRELLNHLGHVLLPHLKEIGVKNILVKRRIEQIRTVNQQTIDIPVELSNLFNVVITKPGYQSVVSAECLALQLDTRMMVGNLSSGLLYTQQLMPKVQTFTYHHWHMAYTQNRYQAIYHDFIQLDAMIYGNDSKFWNCRPTALPCS